jgi:hypothetical protein
MLLVAIGITYAAGLTVLVDRMVLERDEREWFRAVIRQRLTRLQTALPRRS